MIRLLITALAAGALALAVAAPAGATTTRTWNCTAALGQTAADPDQPSGTFHFTSATEQGAIDQYVQTWGGPKKDVVCKAGAAPSKLVWWDCRGFPADDPSFAEDDTVLALTRSDAVRKDKAEYAAPIGPGGPSGGRLINVSCVRD